MKLLAEITLDVNYWRSGLPSQNDYIARPVGMKLEGLVAAKEWMGGHRGLTLCPEEELWYSVALKRFSECPLVSQP